MMKSLATISLAVLCVAAAGCRKSDYRRLVVDVPGMTADNTNKIARAVNFYTGVMPRFTVFDLDRKRLSIVYDSMKVAKMNIYMAIAAADKDGIEVAIPSKSEGPAGYLNDREEEITP